MKEHKIRIIDKNDMTFPRICTHCSKSSPVVVQFGTEGDGPFFDEASFADICPTCLKEAIAALPHESNSEKDLKIEAAFKKLATELSIKTTYITTEEYLKNAGAARIEAERVGRVIVRDKGSDQNRLIISSNRASGLLLEDDKEEGETRHTCCDCKPCLASGLVIHRRSNGEPAFVNTLMNVRRRMAEAEAILYNPAYDAFKRDPAVGILTTEEMAKGEGKTPAVMTKVSPLPVQCEPGRHCAHHGSDPFFCCRCSAEFDYKKGD